MQIQFKLKFDVDESKTFSLFYRIPQLTCEANRSKSVKEFMSYDQTFDQTENPALSRVVIVTPTVYPHLVDFSYFSL